MVWLLILFFLGSAVIGLTLGTIAMVVDAEHYRRVYQDPLTVDAVVSDYDKAREGSAVLAVYLPGEKKPVFHYDLDGDAC